jgi:hypothetical protein
MTKDPRQSDLGVRVILLVYLTLAVLYAIKTPAWQAPDEPAHFNYVKYLVEEGLLPELRPGDYPADYLEQIKAARFPSSMSIDAIRYQSHQPPLYYLLASVVYRLAGPLNLPSYLVLRLFSVLIGAVALLTGYSLARTLYPTQPAIALGAAAFCATLPMHLAMTASVNNDVLAEVLLNFVVWKLVSMRAGAWTKRRAFGLGAALGLALLVKFQSYAAFGVALAALVYDTWLARRTVRGLSWRTALWRALVMFGTALVVASPWILRNITLYGPADPFGLVRHDQVVFGQLTTAQYVQQHGWLGWLSAFATTTFHSFWGQFGWMGVPLPTRVYQALAVLSGLALLGLAAYAVRLLRGEEHLSPAARRGLVLLAVWAAGTVAGYLWWNTQYVQHQGRYLFPALVAWGVGFALGMREVLRRGHRLALLAVAVAAVVVLLSGLFARNVPLFALALLGAVAGLVLLGNWVERRQPGLALGVIYSGLAILAAVCVYAYIVPNLTP